MTMPHPYRFSLPAGAASSAPECPHVCVRCGTRDLLARLSHRSLLLGAVAVVFLMLNVVSAVVTLSTMRLTNKMLLAASTLGPPARSAPPAKSASPPRPSPPEPAQQRTVTPLEAYVPTSWQFDAPHTPERGIVEIAPGERIVDQAIVDDLLEQMAERMGSTRIVPERQDGTVVGIRVYGIRRGSALGMLGVENDDMLETLNGWDLGSPEKALEAYARLRGAREIVLGLTRKGARRFLRYHIR